MHSRNTFITRLGLYDHVVLVCRLWRNTAVNRYSSRSDETSKSTKTCDWFK